MEEELSDVKVKLQQKKDYAKKLVEEGKMEDGIQEFESCIDACVTCIENMKESPNQQDEGESDSAILETLRACIVPVTPGLNWDGIIGQSNAKAALKESIILPFQHPEFFRARKFVSNAVLLYGPPGTGKTVLGRIAASVSNATFFQIRSSQIKSMWSGKSEKSIRLLFQLAREFPISVLLFDEIDALCKSRLSFKQATGDETLSELLQEMSSLDKNQSIKIIGVTNVPQNLDEALLSRFSDRILVDLPTVLEREEIMRHNLMIRSIPNNLRDKDFAALADLTENYSGREIEAIIQDAAKQPLRRLESGTLTLPLFDEKITKDDIMQAVIKIPPSTTLKMKSEIQVFRGNCQNTARTSNTSSKRKAIRDILFKL